MARDNSPIVKQSRREGYALHPKAHKVSHENLVFQVSTHTVARISQACTLHSYEKSRRFAACMVWLKSSLLG